MTGTIFGREPVMILAVVQMAIALVAAFGLSLTGVQTAAIVAFSAAVLGLITRSQVYAPATVAKLTAPDAPPPPP